MENGNVLSFFPPWRVKTPHSSKKKTNEVKKKTHKNGRGIFSIFFSFEHTLDLAPKEE
jgi:hypothetical protein